MNKRKTGKPQNSAPISALVSRVKFSYVAAFLVIIIAASIAAVYNAGFTQEKSVLNANPSANTNDADSETQNKTENQRDQLPTGLRINGVDVSAGELHYALNEVKSAAVAACAGTQDSIGAAFWEENSSACRAEKDLANARSEAERAKSALADAYSAVSREFCSNSRRPADFALCKAIRLLETQHAAYAQAVEGGQMEHGTWDEVIADLQKKNAGNSYMEQSGEVVYGIRSYDLPIYLQQYISQLKDAYVNLDTAPQMALTEAQIEQHYLENEWDFGNKITGESQQADRGSESWDLIQTSVKQDLRTRIYYDLLAARIEAMELDFNREALVDFTKNTFTK